MGALNPIEMFFILLASKIFLFSASFCTISFAGFYVSLEQILVTGSLNLLPDPLPAIPVTLLPSFFKRSTFFAVISGPETMGTFFLFKKILWLAIPFMPVKFF